MTPESVVILLSGLLSLVLEFFPGLAAKWAEASATFKRWFMGVGVFLIVAAAFGLSCAGLAGYFACNAFGAFDAIRVFLLALAVNQGVHLIAKKPSYWRK